MRATAMTLDVYADLFDATLGALSDSLDAAFTESRAASLRPGAARNVLRLPSVEEQHAL